MDAAWMLISIPIGMILGLLAGTILASVFDLNRTLPITVGTIVFVLVSWRITRLEQLCKR